MVSETLIKKIDLLPNYDQQAIENAVNALLEKRNIDTTIISEDLKEKDKSNIRRPVFGSGKGTFGKMSDDFNEPLEDFKDYM